ncbi:hypothetical protein [Demequina iriomotensis]|uniref:hypothetical protein n=1 Tax=Demequina iriomotensis TaxID=1536641 RepID=UPI000781737A|nr:hypothetical protein [Demequina iriomotensis]
MTDVRDLIDFDTPHNYADLLERTSTARDSAHCTLCGLESEPLPPMRLTLIKYRQAGSDKGASRLYCEVHLAQWRDDASASRRPGRRAAEPPEQKICPTCFMQMPLTGGCNTCD